MAAWGAAAALPSLQLFKWSYGYTGRLLRLYSRRHEFHASIWNWSKLISDPDHGDREDSRTACQFTFPRHANGWFETPVSELWMEELFCYHFKPWLHGSIPEEAAELKRHSVFRLHIRSKRRRGVSFCSQPILSPFLSCANQELEWAAWSNQWTTGQTTGHVLFTKCGHGLEPL